jgi:hypothetical protein
MPDAGPPNVAYPLQQNITCQATATFNGQALSEGVTYAWTGATPGTPGKATLNAPRYTAGGTPVSVSCTISKGRPFGQSSLQATAQDELVVFSVASLSVADNRFAILKDGEHDITLMAEVTPALPDGGEIEWQKSADGGSTWQPHSETGTEMTLSKSENAGVYKFRARAKNSSTSPEEFWQVSPALHVLELISIDGYVYGETDRKIPEMEKMTSPAKVIACGYLQFKAVLQPSSVLEDFYYKWTATEGTLATPAEGAGTTYLEAKWDAPNEHEKDASLTLEIRQSSGGAVLADVSIDLRTIRPYVIRVKFVSEQNYDEQQIYDNGSNDDPEFDATIDKHGPVCYVMGAHMKLQADVAGDPISDSGNNLTKSTEVRLVGTAYYGGNNRNSFLEQAINDNTEDWSAADYDELTMETAGSFVPPDFVAEFEDFEIHWTFLVKNSAGQWVMAYQDENGYSQRTQHGHTMGTRHYGLYITARQHEFEDESNFLAYTLDHGCEWALGCSQDDEILLELLERFNAHYYYNNDVNCLYLSKDFWHLCRALGLCSSVDKWSAPGPGGVYQMVRMYPNEFDPAGDTTWQDFCSWFGDGTNPYNAGWWFHAFIFSYGSIYDPSAHETMLGGWADYEDACFEKYSCETPSYPCEWQTNQPGHSLGCESSGVAATFVPDPNVSWRYGFVGPPTGYDN